LYANEDIAEFDKSTILEMDWIQSDVQQFL